MLVGVGGEIELLVGVEIHSLGEHAELHRFEVFWTFRHDDDVCTVFAFHRFAESSRRQELVVDDEAMIVHQ